MRRPAAAPEGRKCASCALCDFWYKYCKAKAPALTFFRKVGIAMSAENAQHPALEQENDLRPEWKILIPTLIVLFCIIVPSVVAPKATEAFFASLYKPFAANLGTLYLWITFILVLMCGYFAFSRWGSIKFGRKDEKPEFSIISWSAMIFCSAVGGAIMFWAITEPLFDIMTPPRYAEPMSVAAYDWALAYLLMHWGPNAWCTYLITALPIAYLLYIRKAPFLRISTACTPIVGERNANGLFGICLDVFFILGLMFCTAVTMCISLPTVAFALKSVFGISAELTTQLYVLFFSGAIAAFTVYKGLDRGIKWLSNFNIFLALVLVVYCFICGPTVKLVNIFTNAFGRWIGYYPSMTLWTDPWVNGGFPQDWTIFYALFWAGFGPFMGLFIARISRGRTVREIIVWGTLSTVAGACLIHGVFGSYSLYVQRSGMLDVVSILKAQGGAAAMIAVLETLPLKNVVLLAYALLSTIFLATTVNAGSYVCASTLTRRLLPGAEPDKWHRTFWAVVLCLLALALLCMGGLGVAKMFGNFSGALMIFPVLFVTACWFRILNEEGGFALKYCCELRPDEAIEGQTPPEHFAEFIAERRN